MNDLTRAGQYVVPNWDNYIYDYVFDESVEVESDHEEVITKWSSLLDVPVDVIVFDRSGARWRKPDEDTVELWATDDHGWVRDYLLGHGLDGLGPFTTSPRLASKKGVWEQ